MLPGIDLSKENGSEFTIIENYEVFVLSLIFYKLLITT